AAAGMTEDKVRIEHTDKPYTGIPLIRHMSNRDFTGMQPPLAIDKWGHVYAATNSLVYYNGFKWTSVPDTTSRSPYRSLARDGTGGLYASAVSLFLHVTFDSSHQPIVTSIGQDSSIRPSGRGASHRLTLNGKLYLCMPREVIVWEDNQSQS